MSTATPSATPTPAPSAADRLPATTTPAPRGPARVVVLGAGYAGVLAANRIAGRLGKRARVTLISDGDELVHRVRLHEVLAGRRWRRYPLARLVRRSVERVRARVERVDAQTRTVTFRRVGAGAGAGAEARTDAAETLACDQLVYALGSRVALDAPGAAAHAGGLGGLDAALAARARLAALPAGAPVVVIGGGLSAIETAAEIAEAHPALRVAMLAGTLAPGLSDEARAYVRATFAELAIALREDVRVARVDADAVVTAAGERVPAALAVWAAGFTGRAAVAGDLPTDGDGRVVTAPTLAVPGAPGVWACGDGAAPPPGLAFLRMACASAMPMGAHVADNVARAVRGEPPAPFRFGFRGQCVSLGRRRGVVQVCDPEDRPTGRVYTARAAAAIKEAICRYVIGSLRFERRWGGLFFWPRSVPALPAALAAPPPTRALPPGEASAP